MAKELLDEVQSLDTAGLDRLRAIDTRTIRELLPELSSELREELSRLAMPLIHCAELSDAELRIAHAQLVGWLEGLDPTMQAGTFPDDAPPAPTITATPAAPGDASDIAASPRGRSQRVSRSPDSAVDNRVVDIHLRQSPVVTARRRLITAIAERIAQKRLTAAQAAAALRLTGPQVTALLNGNIDEFTLDELVNLLPAVELEIQIVAEP